MVYEQVVENDAVATREDTLEVHSSFFRKLKFDKEAVVERVFSLSKNLQRTNV